MVYDIEEEMLDWGSDGGSEIAPRLTKSEGDRVDHDMDYDPADAVCYDHIEPSRQVPCIDNCNNCSTDSDK